MMGNDMDLSPLWELDELTSIYCGKTPEIDVRFYRAFFKTCPVCGRSFYVSLPEAWVYKRRRPRGETGGKLYFHTYSCMRKYDAELEERRRERMARSA